MTASPNAIDIEHLSVIYPTALGLKRVQAVRDVTLSVHAGEIFGFLGPNGAGKTTTIRVLMGLIRARGGTCRIFGHELPSQAARRRLGFLPEAPYFYSYLSVREMLDLSGKLFGLDAGTIRRRGDELIERVGLAAARDMPVKKYSKGMLQRAGIAQALINDPDLVVLDEPMSGLDPVGRKEVRDIIVELRDAGKTVFFSTHILHDVELICDRVAIIVKGSIHDIGALSQLVQSNLISTDVGLRLPDELTADALAPLAAGAVSVDRRGVDFAATLPADVDLDAFLERARELGARVVSVMPRHQTLEDLFIRRAKGGAKGDGEEDRAA